MATTPLTTVALIGTLALTACGGGNGGGGQGAGDGELVEGSWEEIVAAAEEEGAVSFYHGTSPLPAERLIEAFNEKYPDITVTPERITADGIARVEAQLQTDTEGADVFIHADAQWYETFEDNLLALAGPGPEGLQDRAWVIEDKSALAHVAPYSMFVWNTERFPEGFDDWQDFLDPALAGQVAFRNTASTTAIAFLDFLLENLGEDYVAQLAELSTLGYPSIVPMTAAVAAGEAGVTMASSPADVFALQDQGAPIDYAYTEPAFGIEYAMAALDNSRRPNAAVVFVDFALSKEGQEALNGDGLGVSYHGDVDALDAEDYTMMDATKYTDDVRAELTEKLETYFGGSGS